MLHEVPMVFTCDGLPLAGTLVRGSASFSERHRCAVVTGASTDGSSQPIHAYLRRR